MNWDNKNRSWFLGNQRQIKRFVSLSLFLIFTQLVFSQSEIDSLKQVLGESRGKQRAEILLEISKNTRQKDILQAISQAKEAFEISKNLDNHELWENSIQQLAFYNTIANRDTTALKYLLSALKTERQYGHRLVEAEVLFEIGKFYSIHNSNTKALDCFFRALRIQIENNKNDAAETLSYIGNVYSEREELEQAVLYHKQAAKLGVETGNYRIVAISAVKVANNLHKLDKFEAAKAYFQKALDAANAIKSVHARAGIILSMSMAYKDEKLYDKAIELNQDLLEIARKKESKVLLARGHENLAEIYEVQQNKKKANSNYEKAIQYYEESSMPVGLTVNKYVQNLLEMGQPEKAVKIGEGYLPKLEKNSDGKIKLLKTLTGAYQQQGDFSKAFQHQQALMKINSIVYNKEKSQQIAAMQTRYEVERKEREIELLEKKQEKATLLRNGMLIGVTLLIVIVLLIYNRQQLKIKKRTTRIENIQLKQEQLQKDLDFKNKQLTTLSLNLVQKNEVMKELKQNITHLNNQPETTPKQITSGLLRLVDYSFNLDKDWEDFKLYFEGVHTGFFNLLKSRYPNLSGSELRLAALVKLNLTSKEIATLLKISPDSVKTARYRLRKKMDLETNQNLIDFLFKIDREVSASRN